MNNIPYELGLKSSPLIKSAKELLEVILKDRKSLSRFGDGGLEIMQNRERPWFQIVDAKLSERLREIFSCKDERIIIALADDFGNLERYTEKVSDSEENSVNLLEFLDIPQKELKSAGALPQDYDIDEQI